MASENFNITKTFSLKNMVSKSCIRLIKEYFLKFEAVKIIDVRLGEVNLSFKPSKIKIERIEKEFVELGFAPLKNKEDELVENIKIAAIELIHHAYNANSLIRNSDYISEKLCTPYSKLSKVFSEKTGITLEKFLIKLKIEKVKELIMFEDFTLSEIAFLMGYSSVNYLSNQFKQITGLTVSDFKIYPIKHRIPFEDLI